MVEEKVSLKLYIWEGKNVLESYGTGIIGAMAHDLEEAQYVIVRRFYEEGIMKRPMPSDWKEDMKDDEDFGIIFSKEPEIYDHPKGFYLYGSD